MEKRIGVCNLCALVFGNNELGSKVRDALARLEADRTQTAAGLWLKLRAAMAGAAT